MNDVDRSLSYLPLMREIPAFAKLGEASVRFLAGGSLLRNAARGQLLCDKGKPPPGVQCVLSGRVKLGVLSAQGSERVIDILLPGRIFGLAAILLDAPCPVFAEALAPARILVIGRERIQTAIIHWPEIGEILLKLMSADVHRLVHDLEACCLMSARQRLVEHLLQSAATPAGCLDRAVVVLSAPKAVIASSLNISAETFSRELRELAERGLIRIERRTIAIPSLNRLSQLLTDGSVASGGQSHRDWASA